MPSVDWDELQAAAIDIMGKAYAPYSRFKVGVAGLMDDGRIVTGCNVENAAYGVGLCAECGMVSSIHATGGGKLVAVACVDQHGAALMPCGPVPPASVGERAAHDADADAGGDPAAERDPAAGVRTERPRRARRGPTVIEPFHAVDIIKAKRDKRVLTHAEIVWVVDAYTRGAVADEQMAALAMAILLNGMTEDEIVQWDYGDDRHWRAHGLQQPAQADCRQALHRGRR